MVFLGESINAEQAEYLGLVNMVVKKEYLMDTTMKFAEKLSQKAPIALKIAKEYINNGVENNVENALNYEADLWAQLII